MPVLAATIRHFDTHQQQTSNLDPKVIKALKRRERLKHRRNGEDDNQAIFKVTGRPLLPTSCVVLLDTKNTQVSGFKICCKLNLI